MSKYRVLAVEDEVTTQVLLQRCLVGRYELMLAATVLRAKEALQEGFAPDLVLLDLHLPDGSGFELLEILKENSMTNRIPVVFLSLEADVRTKVKSFSAGAYDYITKPFDCSELIARIDTHCARAGEVMAALYTPETFADLFFDRRAKLVFRILTDGKKIPLGLTPTEYKLLECLVLHQGKTLSREHLAKEVWRRAHFQSRTIDRHISSLRRKMGDSGNLLKTVSQGGYLLSEA